VSLALVKAGLVDEGLNATADLVADGPDMLEVLAV
jgi:hypothetical protein